MGKGLPMGPPRRIPFNTGDGLQIRLRISNSAGSGLQLEPSKNDSIIIDDLEPGKKPIGLGCTSYGKGLQLGPLKK